MSRPQKFLLVILASVLPHLYGISAPLLDNHYQRQTETATVARNFHDNGMDFLKPQVDWAGDYRGRASTEFPLYMYLMALLWDVFSLAEIWGRILAAAFSALTAAVLLLFLEGWLERRAAFCAALVFGFIPIEVYFGRTVQPEASALFFTILAYLCLDRYLRGRSLWNWAGACAAAFLAVGLKLPYAYLWGVCAVLAWARLGWKAFKDAGTLLFFPVSVLPAWLWYKYASVAVGIIPIKNAGFTDLLHYSWFHAQFIFTSRFPEILTGWPGFILWLAGAWSARKLDQAAKSMLWGWFACVCVYILGLGYYGFGHEYTALPFALVNASFMGLGLAALWEKASDLGRPQKTWAQAGLLLLLLGMPVHTAFRIKHWYRLNFPFLTEARKAVDSVSGPDDLFLCHNLARSMVLFYIHRRGWNVYSPEENRPLIDRVEEKMGEGAKFLFAPKESVFLGRGDPKAKPIYQRFPIVYEDKDYLIFRLKP